MQSVPGIPLSPWAMPSAMSGGRAVVLQGSGIAGLKISTLPRVPAPKAHDIVIKVLAVCLNHRDQFGIQGSKRGGFIPCSDAVGRVIEIGSKVTRVKIGDRVCPIFTQNYLSDSNRASAFPLGNTKGLPGTLCETMLLSETNVVVAPSHLTDEEACTLPCAGVTAWRGLVTEGRFKTGETLLVEGTGGVSIFGAQFAKALGGKVICTSSSDNKLDTVQEMLGVDHVINYRKYRDWGKKAKKEFGGADHVLEIGGAGTLDQAMMALNNNGSIAVIGLLQGIDAKINVVQFFVKQIRMNGISVGSREDFEEMNKCITKHRIKPVVNAVFPFNQSHKAFELMASGDFIGQIVISINGPRKLSNL
jgi:NADPH:quinone reductase-like Zn-dependent oxidoreductase